MSLCRLQYVFMINQQFSFLISVHFKESVGEERALSLVMLFLSQSVRANIQPPQM
jgi:hypothetical protein